MAKKSLKPEVAEKYKLVKVPEAGVYQVNGFGTIDLAKIEIGEAHNLVKIGFPLLTLRKKSS